METPTLIYCAGKNPRFDRIAISAGFKTGIQLPCTNVDFPPFFVDQNWKSPERQAYMESLKKHQPTMATVLDLEQESQFKEVMSWAEEAAQYVEIIVIIPKVSGIIPQIPQRINGAIVVLGYSVPTRFGGTSVPVWEFGNRPVHLLGGSPSKQREYSAYLNVVSADGNYANMAATKFCKWFDGKRWHKLKNDVGDLWGKDAPYECFRRSCKGIISMWAQHNKSLHATKPALHSFFVITS